MDFHKVVWHIYPVINLIQQRVFTDFKVKHQKGKIGFTQDYTVLKFHRKIHESSPYGQAHTDKPNFWENERSGSFPLAVEPDFNCSSHFPGKTNVHGR